MIHLLVFYYVTTEVKIELHQTYIVSSSLKLVLALVSGTGVLTALKIRPPKILTCLCAHIFLLNK